MPIDPDWLIGRDWVPALTSLVESLANADAKMMRTAPVVGRVFLDDHSATRVEKLTLAVPEGTVSAYFKAADLIGPTSLTPHRHTKESATAAEVSCWWLAQKMGEPWATFVMPTILTHYRGKIGSLSLETEWPPRWKSAKSDAPELLFRAALFDALTAQQDRHKDDVRCEGQKIVLLDHGFSFPVPGASLYHTNIHSWRYNENPRRHPLAEDERHALEKAKRSICYLYPILGDLRSRALEQRLDQMISSGEILKPSRNA